MNDDNNPYSRNDSETAISKIKVFSHIQVMVAMFCGTLFCSAFMVERNYKAFGDPITARKAFWITIAIAVVVTAVSVSLPGYRYSTMISFGVLYGIGEFYKKNMKEQYNKYITDGGQKEGNWKLFGMIILTVIVVMAILIGALIGLEEIGIETPE